MPARPLYLGTDVLQRARDLEFRQRADRDIWQLGFSHQAESDINSLSKLIEPPQLELQAAPEQEPLPIVVSDRPDALALQRQAQERQAAQQPMMQPQQQASELATVRTSMPVAMDAEGQRMPTSERAANVPAAGGEYRAYARQVAQAYGLDPDIFERQINQESGFQPWGADGKPLGSPAGAQGIAQFMPGTAASYGVDVNDPYSSLEGAARHMRDLLRANNGNYRLALAAYNAGQGNVDKYGEGVFGDDFAHGETKRYVQNILGGGAPDMPRLSLNAAPVAAPGRAAPPAPAGVSSAPAGAPPAPWEMAGAQDGGPMLLKENDETAAFLPGDGGTAPAPEYDPRQYDEGQRESRPAPILPTDPTVTDPAYTQSPTGMTYGPVEQGEVQGPQMPAPVQNQITRYVPTYEARAAQVAPTMPSPAANAVQAGIDAGVEAYNDPFFQAGPQPPRWVKIVSDAMQAFGAESAKNVARSLGVTDEEWFNVFGYPISRVDVAGFAGGMAADPTNYVGLNAADPLVTVARGAVRDFAPEAVKNVGRAVGSTLREGAESLGRGLQGVGREVAGGLMDLNPAMTPRIIGDGPGIGRSMADGAIPSQSARNADAAIPSGIADSGPNNVPNRTQSMPSQRLYHGTGSPFDVVDPSKFDENGLFGPGYYLTSDPRVANGYASVRAGQFEPIGANVRAVDVPKNLRLWDLDAPGVGSSTFEALDSEAKWLTGQRLSGVGPNSTPEAVYDAFVDRLISLGLPPGEAKAEVNRSLVRVFGFDGIKHTGGRRNPLMDADGNPIEHDVTIIFPESLTKIRNAFSGEVGGATLGVSPGPRGAGIGTQLATDAGNALAGSMVGAVAPADTPEERLRNTALGAAGFPIAGRLMRRAGGTLATFGTSPNYRPPSAARVQAAQAQGARRGAQLNRTVSAPPSEVPAGVRAATVATDDRAAMRWAEDMLSDAAGNPRMRENDPARPSTLSRVNAGAVANERLANELEPAIVSAGRAGLQDELPQHLEDMHQLDILDEFYRRGHQEVMDARAQAIATAQASNASPATIQRMQAKAQADAHAAGLRKMRQRQGSNPDMTYEAIEARLKAQEQRVTAAGKKQELDDAAQAIWDHNAETRQRLVDAGEMDPTDAAHYAQAYPHYVPTVPISHLDARGGQAVSASSGTRVSRGNQGIVKALEDVGTSGERLNPIVASRNATIRAERAIQRNNVARAFAQMMDDALQASPSTMGTNAATHRTFLGGGVDVTFFDNGKPVTMSVPKPIADGLEAAANMGMSSNGLASIWKRVMGAVTSTMTAARASFLPVNLLRDVQDFATRTMAREGGPQNLPSILATWVDEAGRAAADIAMAQMNPRGLAGAASGAVTGAVVGDENRTPAERLRDAFVGGVAGTFLVGANRVTPTGNARQFMARGGGSGAASADWRVGQRWYRDVMRQGGVPIKTPAEMARFFADWGGDILSLQGVKGINERTELISRTAAMRRAEQGGSGPVEAMIAGRDATVDFDRAGTWARMVNGIVPFFNATVQGGAQTVRAIRNNPVAFSASIAATVAPAMLAAEAWNRSDPARAAVYDDVPQYVKDTGFVVVTPWAGSDNRGERPNYVWIPTGMATPFVIGMRGAMEGLPGLEPVSGRVGTRADASTPEKWIDVFEQVAQVFSPIRGDSAASVASNFVPPIAKQVVELGQNKDMFRGNPIASDSADERASAFGRRVAEGANAAGRMVGSDFLQEVRPSQVDYLARQLPAYGDIITGASDMVAPSGYKQAEDRPVQNAPFSGGMAARFVRDTGGANIQRAQDEALSDPVREVFEAAGMRPSELTPVPSRWKNGTLTRDEQLRWQEAFNAEIGRAMAEVRRDPNWRDPAKREQAVMDALSAARERAAERARLPGADAMERRIRNEQRMKAS